jgi:hypothetical protein
MTLSPCLAQGNAALLIRGGCHVDELRGRADANPLSHAIASGIGEFSWLIQLDSPLLAELSSEAVAILPTKT